MYDMTDLEAATLARNLDFLADQTKLASNGFFTVTMDDHRHISLVRNDGQAMGYRDDNGHPITGLGLSTYVSAYTHLTRRDRVTLKDIHNAIRTVIWGQGHWDVESWAYAREDLAAGNADDPRFAAFLHALMTWTARNRLDAVKDSHGRL